MLKCFSPGGGGAAGGGGGAAGGGGAVDRRKRGLLTVADLVPEFRLRYLKTQPYFQKALLVYDNMEW